MLPSRRRGTVEAVSLAGGGGGSAVSTGSILRSVWQEEEEVRLAPSSRPDASPPAMLQPRQLLRLRLPASRHLSTSPLLLSKASKSRTGAKGKPSPKPFRSPSATLEALRGTGVGASSRLYGKDDAVVGRDEGAAESPAARKEAAAPSLFEAAAPAGEVQGGKEVEERLRGTGAGASELLYPKDGVHVTGRDEEGSASQAGELSTET